MPPRNHPNRKSNIGQNFIADSSNFGAGVARRGPAPKLEELAMAGDEGIETVGGTVIPHHKTVLGSPLGTLRAFCDWLSYTMPLLDMTPAAAAQEIIDLFPGVATPTTKDFLGYGQGVHLACGGLVLWSDAKPELKVHVSLGGQALSTLGYELIPFLRGVIAAGGKFTRLDIACDNDRVSMSYIWKVVPPAESPDDHQGNLVVRTKKRLWIVNETGGKTLYIGSRSSRKFVRIYDKANEQGDYTSVLTRCEVEFKREYAHRAAEHLINGSDMRELILAAVDFRDRSAHSEIEKCPRLDWWEDWVGGFGRVSFASAVTRSQTVQDVYDWVQRSVSPSLALLDRAFGRDPSWIFGLIDANERRINPVRLAALNNYQQLE